MNKIRSLPPLETGLVFSLALHLGLWQFLSFKQGATDDLSAQTNSLEIDLTRPFRLTADPLKAHKAKNLSSGGRIVENPAPAPWAETAKTVEPQKEWTLPGPKTKILEKLPAEDAPVPSPDGEKDGTGQGWGGRGGPGAGGEVDWIYLTTLPRLLNKEELLRNMRRFYPEQERRAGREGQVVLTVHLDVSGNVTNAEVEKSAGVAFDDAAKKVIASARFSPAMVQTKAVPVKIIQAVTFQLE